MRHNTIALRGTGVGGGRKIGDFSLGGVILVWGGGVIYGALPVTAVASLTMATYIIADTRRVWGGVCLVA